MHQKAGQSASYDESSTQNYLNEDYHDEAVNLDVEKSYRISRTNDDYGFYHAFDSGEFCFAFSIALHEEKEIYLSQSDGALGTHHALSCGHADFLSIVQYDPDTDFLLIPPCNPGTWIYEFVSHNS